jgi:hypothetical protein
VETIKRNIISEQLYGDEIERTVKNISASEVFFKEVLFRLLEVLVRLLEVLVRLFELVFETAKVYSTL